MDASPAHVSGGAAPEYPAYRAAAGGVSMTPAVPSGAVDPLLLALFTPGWRNQGAGSFWAGVLAARAGVAARPWPPHPVVWGATHPFLAGVLTCR